MRTRMRALISWGLMAMAFAMAAPAQQPASEQSRMDRFEQRLADLEMRYQEELKTRDEEIARLRAVIEKHDRQLGATTVPATRPMAQATAPPPSESDRLRQQVLEDASARGSARQVAERIVADLNPQIAVITDFVASLSDARRNDALNRVDVREAELDLRAAVHPRADGVLILAFERDAENPVFPEEPPEGPESAVSIEEAYLYLHDLGIRNLTAKIGRYHLRFGRQNMLHLHDLPTVTPPLVNQAFLSPEALTDAGVSLSYVLPNPWDQYIEVIAEVISGEGADSESPTLAGDLSVDSPAVNLHALWNTDLTDNWNLELGTSWLSGHADSDNARDVNLFGLDATLIRRDPRGGFNNQLFQAELMYGQVDAEGDDRNYSLGAYVLGQQQLSRDWYAGLRLDWTEDPNDDTQEAWGVAPYVSWYWTEFLRFRAMYEYVGGDQRDDHILWLQATWIFGSHPVHPYWSMR